MFVSVPEKQMLLINKIVTLAGGDIDLVQKAIRVSPDLSDIVKYLKAAQHAKNGNRPV